MKNRTTSQTGSAAAVVIGVLFIALMATLGVVFYQNFIQKKQDTTADKQPAAVAPADQTVTARTAFDSTIYSLDYPQGWTAETTKIKASKMGGTTTTITNADGTIQVELDVSEIAPNTTCDKNDGLHVTYYDVDDVVVKKLTDSPLYLVQALTDNKGGGYQYTIGLVPDGGDTHASLGDTHCNVSHVGVVSQALTDGQKVVHPTIQALIKFPKLPKAPKPAAADMQTIKDLMDGDDYKAAVKILESARKE